MIENGVDGIDKRRERDGMKRENYEERDAREKIAEIILMKKEKLKRATKE